MTDLRAGYRPILDRLLALYDLPEMKVRPGYRKVAHIAHGWYMRCHRGAQAVLLLDADGYAEEAAGIRRSIIEHAVALRWLATEGDKLNDTIARAHAFTAERRLEAVVAADWQLVDPAELRAIIDEIDADSRESSSDYLLQFARQLEKYDDGQTKPGWLAESARTHPSYESAMAYIELPSGNPLFRSRVEVDQGGFLCAQLLQALVAVRSIFDPAPWEGDLTELIGAFRSVTDQVRDEAGLPTGNWMDASTYLRLGVPPE